MRIAETLNEGLKRAYSVTIPAATLASKVDAQLATVAAQIRMPGFRPGKVPTNLVRKMHGAQLSQEALSEAVQEAVNKVVAEHGLRPAMQPRVDLDKYQEGRDVALKVELEVLPAVTLPAVEGIKLEKLVTEPTDADMDEALQRFADQQKSFEAAPAGHAAAIGDAVLVDFKGTVDGDAFEGGAGEGMQIELGSGRLIPGFEDQLVGARANEQRTVKVSFPEDYNVDYLKGRAAEFAVTVNEVQTAKTVGIDDALASNLGIETLDKLKEILKDSLSQETAGLTRTHMKRKLLDHLAASSDFAVPQSMVDAEFDQIWAQLEHEAGHDSDPEAARASIEGDRDEYRRIAERRVRLGLLLSEIGQQNGVQVTNEEMNRLVMQEAGRYAQDQRAQVVKYFAENPIAAAQLRAPLYEDKVVDWLIGKADVTERQVGREELQAAIESEDETPLGHVHGPDCGHDHDHDHAPAKPKKAAKKAAVAAEPAVDTAVASEVAAKPKKAKAKPADDSAPPAKTRKTAATSA